MLADMLWLLYGAYICVLIASFKWKRLWIEVEVLMAVSFIATTCALFWVKKYWMGAAFAFPALRQSYVLLKYLNRKPIASPLTKPEALETK
jgi:hypothetical protein